MHAARYPASSMPVPSQRIVRALARTLGRCLASTIATLRRWRALAAERRALLALDDAALKDIGLSRADAYREACRRFWDDPLQARHPAAQAQGREGWLPGGHQPAGRSDSA